MQAIIRMYITDSTGKARQIRIQAVADHSEISISTVSRTLNDSSKVGNKLNRLIHNGQRCRS